MSTLISALPLGARFELQAKHSEAISDREHTTVIDSTEVVTLIEHGHLHEKVQHVDGHVTTVPDHRVWVV